MFVPALSNNDSHTSLFGLLGAIIALRPSPPPPPPAQNKQGAHGVVGTMQIDCSTSIPQLQAHRHVTRKEV